jgi:hypothetical protein
MTKGREGEDRGRSGTRDGISPRDYPDGDRGETLAGVDSLYVQRRFLDITTLFQSPIIGGYAQGYLVLRFVLVEIPILMIGLSRILSNRVNRWANIGVGIFLTVIQLGRLFVGSPTLAYSLFLGGLIGASAVIAWFSWRWRP